MTPANEPLQLPCGQVLPTRHGTGAVEALSALRGVIAGALDPRLARNPRIQAAIAELDARTHVAP